MKMEVDRVMYIFGSFARRRQSEEPSAAKRRSLEPTTISAGNSPARLSPAKASPGPRALSLVERVCPSSEADDKFRCFICKRTFSEPRVLPCLHTFCTWCLQNICSSGGEINNLWNEQSGALVPKKDVSGSHSGSGSAASGYESEQRTTTDSDESLVTSFHAVDVQHAGGFYTKVISGKDVSILVCPLCGNENRLPKGGVLALPPNFVLQHRMVVASLNRNTSRILCDLCSPDTLASSRCLTCLVSMCTFCGEAHVRQRGTAHHSVGTLDCADADAIKRLRRQAMCTAHPENELKIFCTTCSQVVCRDCCLISHTGHTFEAVSKAAQLFTRTIRDAVERTKPVTRRTSIAIEKLNSVGLRIQTKTAAVHDEVDEFIDSYAKAVEEHRKTLQVQLLKARETKLQALQRQTTELERRAENALDAVQFAEDVLKEGTDVEVLSFVGPLLRRLEWCNNLEILSEPRVSEIVQLLKSEKSSYNNVINLCGIISTQSVAPHLSVLIVEGLRCIRVNKKNEITLEVRDIENQPLCHGGHNVTGYFRYCEAPMRPLPLQIEDLRNGTYIVSLTPEVAGNIQLAILINGKPIKDSPFSSTARNLRPHHGKYHCCTFCSTGGNKETDCGCGSIMGGGYKGCGHGHDGHPGSRHWSCCGNIQQNSECIRTNSAIYQYTL